MINCYVTLCDEMYLECSTEKKGVPQSESELKLYQQLKGVNKSKLLTTKHPGMDTFHDSVTLSATSVT